mmetsp:Transcript_13137/g.15910  ORF Transcript_13137/g.15910 Transcript_13137/m.15910 type:complete len:306 (-) Transcript_13137:727-1644(-)|eukprot:CAMPEP_0197847082 /NCGR_PEP_ID=MMETSP1438-20131217/5187_1 /TAXON_ID=1461541 /ORGANISM="Pterosperma sp., Strain CCMP1384" /LENGTH=305 /DNA_ID=CAMNT_0043458899 /DNA_START=292 /DNA_END=1209 /DNA_ORIENTATION=-
MAQADDSTSTADVNLNVLAAGPQRDLEAARKAYAAGDAHAARQAHDRRAQSSEAGTELIGTDYRSPEDHSGEGGKYVKSLVFGGLDGIITTFAVVAAVAGGDLSRRVAVLMGFANLLADGMSMGFGDYLSSKAELEYAKSETSREKWEMDNYLDGEKKEMIELYMEKGISEDHATTVIEILAQYPSFFLDLMVTQELGIMPPDDADNPAMNGVVTAFAFFIFGLIPLLSYVILPNLDDQTCFIVACVLTALTMATLGAVKATFTRQNKLKSGALMLVNGGAAASAAYLAGWAISLIVKDDDDAAM